MSLVLRIHVSTSLPAVSNGMAADADAVAAKLRAAVTGLPGHSPLPRLEDVAARSAYLNGCTLVVASLLAPCFQVGIEIERAFVRGIPILFVAWGRPSYGGVHPQLSGFPPHEEYARGLAPLILGEEWALEIEPEFRRRLEDPALLGIVQAHAEKRSRSRISTSGFPEL